MLRTVDYCLDVSTNGTTVKIFTGRMTYLVDEFYAAAEYIYLFDSYVY